MPDTTSGEATEGLGAADQLDEPLRVTDAIGRDARIDSVWNDAAAKRPVGDCGGAPPGAGKVGARIAPVDERRPEAAAVERCSRAADRSSAKEPALVGRREGSVCQATWRTASTSSAPSVGARRGHAER